MAIHTMRMRNHLAREYAALADYIGVATTISPNIPPGNPSETTIPTVTGEGPYNNTAPAAAPANRQTIQWLTSNLTTSVLTVSTPATVVVTAAATYNYVLVADSFVVNATPANPDTTVVDYCKLATGVTFAAGGGQIVVTPTYTQS